MLPSELPDLSTGAAFDTETSGLFQDDGARVATVSVAWHEPDGAITSYAFPFDQGCWGKPAENTEIRVPLPKTGYAAKSPKLWERRKRIELAGPDPNLDAGQWWHMCNWLSKQELVAHNALYDLLLMRAGAGRGWEGVDLETQVVWCTMLGQRVLDPEYSLALKPSTDRLFGLPPSEQDRLRTHLKKIKAKTGDNPRYDLADPWVCLPYAADDTRRTIRLARHQWRRMSDGEAPWSQLEFEMDTMRTLYRMEKRGVPYKAAESASWAAKMRVRVEQMETELPFGDTPNEVRQYFFGAGTNDRGSVCLELKPIKVTAVKKEPCIDAEVMRELVDKGVPAALDYQEYALTTDAVSRYYQGYADFTAEDGRLRTRFRQTGTRSGRLSCERVNLQAIPNDHRMLASGSTILAEAPSPKGLVYAPQGWELWNLDLKQAELRVAAEYADCKPMLQIIYDGRDPHGETAIGLNLANPGDANWDPMRNVGKRGNFSLIFGIGPDKFRGDLRKQVGVDMGATKTRQIVNDWNELYPEFKRALDRYHRAAQRDGWTFIRENYRRYYSDPEKGIVQGKKQRWDDLYKAFNQKVQGNLGYFARTWMVRADEYLMDNGVDRETAGLLLQVHDSLLLLLPEGRRDLAQGVSDIATEMWPHWFDVPGGVDLAEWKH